MIRHPLSIVSVVLVASALAVAGSGSAQDRSGISEGLHAPPDIGRGVSPDEAAAAKPADPAGRLKHPAVDGPADSAAGTPNRAEPMWIAILSSVGILVSLAAGGYIWRSRARSPAAKEAVIPAVQRKPAATPDRIEEQGAPSRRRAA